MKNIIILSLILTIVGCSSEPHSTKNQTLFEKAKNAVGLGPSAEQIAAKKEKEKEELRQADSLVASLADSLKSDSINDGFIHPEGIELDPWGNKLEIKYSQEWFQEIATVISYGPDEVAGTVDDLVRTRKTYHLNGIFSGIPVFGWVLSIWLLCSFLSFYFSNRIGKRRLRKGKSNHHRNDVLFALVSIGLAPLCVLIYGLQLVGGALGATGEFFDGFDFDFDIDL